MRLRCENTSALRRKTMKAYGKTEETTSVSEIPTVISEMSFLSNIEKHKSERYDHPRPVKIDEHSIINAPDHVEAVNKSAYRNEEKSRWVWIKNDREVIFMKHPRPKKIESALWLVSGHRYSILCYLLQASAVFQYDIWHTSSMFGFSMSLRPFSLHLTQISITCWSKNEKAWQKTSSNSICGSSRVIRISEGCVMCR